MEQVFIGPFTITFMPNNVEFRALHQSDRTLLTYTECYKLLEVLYQRRDDLYRRTHDEASAEEPVPLHLDDLNITYTVNQDALSIASWARPDGEAQAQQ